MSFIRKGLNVSVNTIKINVNLLLTGGNKFFVKGRVLTVIHIHKSHSTTHATL